MDLFVDNLLIDLFFLESILEFSSGHEKMFLKIHKKLFNGRLLELSTHDQGNFAVQRFFENILTAEMFSLCWAEVASSVEKILASGYTGVVLAVVKSCVKLKCDQAAVLKQLGAALHCDESLEQLAPACIKVGFISIFLLIFIIYLFKPLSEQKCSWRNPCFSKPGNCISDSQ